MRALAALAVLAAGVAHADVVYSDGVFAPSNWGFEFQTLGAGGSATAVQMSVGGNPDFCRRVSLSLDGGDAPQIGALSRFGTTQATRYEPAIQGAIESVSFSIDFRRVQTTGTAGQFVQAALKQGTEIYAAAGAFTGDAEDWTTYSVVGLTAATFVPLFGGQDRPDFSANGLPIRFGFLTRHTGGADQSFTAVDYDNFLVRVIPAPGLAAFVAAGGVLVARRRRHGS